MDEDRTDIEEEPEDTDCSDCVILDDSINEDEAVDSDCVILDDSINEDETAAVDSDCVIVTPKKIKMEVAPVNDQYE